MATLSDFNLRYEFAAADNPRSITPAYTDLTSKVRAGDPVSLRRGRQNEQDSAAQPGTATTTLLNTTGAFTMGNTGSPYAPLQIRRPCRYRVRYGTAAGNLLAAEDASFEGGTIGAWLNGTLGYLSPTLANSAVHAQSGTKSMLVTWPTAGALGSSATLAVSGLTIGRAYTFSGYVWVDATNPAVVIGDPFASLAGSIAAPAGFSRTTSTTGSFQRIAMTFTALAASGFLNFANSVAATVGQTCWIDGVMLDEGTTVGTFTTTAPPIYNLWQGFVDTWGNSRDATTGIARVPASDRLARAATNKLRAAIDAEILIDSPLMFYPLDDPSGATTLGDRTGRLAVPVLNSTQLGTGGTITLGSGTAPGPDGGSTLLLTRASVGNGKYLTTSTDYAINGGVTGHTLAAFAQPSSIGTASSIARCWAGASDQDLVVDIGINSTGKATASVTWAPLAISVSLAGTTTLPTTSFTHVAVTQSAPAAGTVTVRLYVNGVQESSGTYTTPAFTLATSRLNIGGIAAIGQGPWDGQISRLGVWASELTAARLLEHAKARLSWTGETSDVRFKRLCRVAGLPTSAYSASVTGLSTMGAQATSGVSLLDAIKDVAESENGVVYVNPSGVLQFQPRSARYNSTSALTLDASKAGQVYKDAEAVTDTTQLINDATVTRPGGATIRVVDAASVTNYDTHDQTITLNVDTDALVQASAEWRVYTNSTPKIRVSKVTVDVVAFASGGGNVAQLLSSDVSTHITLTNLPADVSATSTLELFVEGVTDDIGKSQWLRTFDTSPVGPFSAFTLDSATYGVLDGTSILAY